MAGTVRFFDAFPFWRRLFRLEDLVLSVSLHLDSRNVAELSLRPVNGFWLEVFDAAGDLIISLITATVLICVRQLADLRDVDYDLLFILFAGTRNRMRRRHGGAT